MHNPYKLVHNIALNDDSIYFDNYRIIFIGNCVQTVPLFEIGLNLNNLLCNIIIMWYNV